MAEPKDVWDKWDIVLKAAVPVAVGSMLLVWNSQRTTQQTTAAMTEIAIGILTEEPEPDRTNALREWAISVLQNPANPPSLSEQAAKELAREGLPIKSLLGELGSLSSLADLTSDLKQLESLDLDSLTGLNNLGDLSDIANETSIPNESDEVGPD